MKLVDERTRLGIAYLAAMDGAGYSPTVAEFRSFLTSPGPGLRAGTGLGAFLDRGLVGFGGMYVSDFDDPVKWYCSVGWIRLNQGRLNVTDAGRAAAKAFPPDAAPANDDAVAVFRPDEQFAYARLLGHVAELDDVLLVDPYLRPEQFEDLAKMSNVRRLLVGDRAGVVAALGAALRGWPDPPQVRSAAGLHDRFLASKGGDVRSIGVSFNGVKGKLTTLVRLPPTAAKAVRAEIDKFWADASTVEPAAVTPEQPTS